VIHAICCWQITRALLPSITLSLACQSCRQLKHPTWGSGRPGENRHREKERELVGARHTCCMPKLSSYCVETVKQSSVKAHTIKNTSILYCVVPILAIEFKFVAEYIPSN